MTTIGDITELPLPRQHPLDPPPKYRELLNARPMTRVRTPQGDTAWFVARHEDAQAVLNDRRFSSDPRSPGFPSYMTAKFEPAPGFFMAMDAPDHPRLRKFVSRELVTSTIEPMRPQIEQLFDRLLSELTRSGRSAELIKQLALPMAATVICDLLGAAPEDRELVKHHVDILLDRSKSAEEQGAAGFGLFTYFDKLVTTKKQNPSDDMLGRLVRVADGGGLTHQELIGIASLILLGGYDTMVQMIGLGVITMLEHPEQLAAIRADKALVPSAVDELLRFLTVNHAGLPRAALEDVVVGDQRIRAGEGVLVMINAANRDPSAFPDADKFDIRRSTAANSNAHLAFGHGLHKCIGTAVAKVELETVFARLFSALPDLRIAKPLDELPFRHTMVLYGVEELPVAW